jgi:mono/diheme cytochrome c family protein
MIRKLPLTLPPVLLLIAAMFGAADGSWLKNVPQRDHERTSPYHDSPDAIAPGRRIFVDRCSHCHGDNAEGTKKRPPYRERTSSAAGQRG